MAPGIRSQRSFDPCRLHGGDRARPDPPGMRRRSYPRQRDATDDRLEARSADAASRHRGRLHGGRLQRVPQGAAAALRRQELAIARRFDGGPEAVRTREQMEASLQALPALVNTDEALVRRGCTLRGSFLVQIDEAGWLV